MKKFIIVILLFVGCSSKKTNEYANNQSENIGVTLQDSILEVVEEKPRFLSNVEFIEKAKNSFRMPNGKNSEYHAIYVKNFNKDDEKVWNDLSEYASDYICQDGGFLAVFFFDLEDIPFNTRTNLEWTEEYDKNCVGAKWCYPNGTEEVKRFPMK